MINVSGHAAHLNAPKTRLRKVVALAALTLMVTGVFAAEQTLQHSPHQVKMGGTAASLITAPTQFVEGDGVRFAYRRFGKKGVTPVVFVQHFRGNLDNFDPAVTDPLAAQREVIVFDNAGVGSSSGPAKNTIEAMAKDAESFIAALGLKEIDVLGHSMGGYVAQQMVIDRPELVRRLVLVGTGPRGGEGMATRSEYTAKLFTDVYNPQDLMWTPIFFSLSEKGKAAGREYFERTHLRKIDRDAPVATETAAAHGAAARAWGAAGGSQAYLKQIAQPVLVVNGSNDVVVPTVNSYLLQQQLPDARLVLFPDSNHGVHFQYHDIFVREVNEFLNAR